MSEPTDSGEHVAVTTEAGMEEADVRLRLVEQSVERDRQDAVERNKRLELSLMELEKVVRGMAVDVAAMKSNQEAITHLAKIAVGIAAAVMATLAGTGILALIKAVR